MQTRAYLALIGATAIVLNSLDNIVFNKTSSFFDLAPAT